MTTKVTRNMLNTSIDDNGNATAITIDSSERILIGSDSGDAFNDDSMLRLQRTGDRVFIQLKTDADQNSGILFGDVDDDVECAIEYEPANKALTLSTGNNDEAIRVFSSGDIGLNTTTINSGTLGTSNKFLEVAAGTASGSGTLILSRNTSANNVELGGVRFVNANNADDDGLDADGKLVAAVSARSVTSDSNAGDDSGADLIFYTKPEAGNYAERVRILSSGGLTFNGDTATANALNDYEEGTWTPTSVANIDSLTNVQGFYTKIGRMVYCLFHASVNPTVTSSGFNLGGLPFTVDQLVTHSGIQGTSAIFSDSAIFLCFPLQGGTTLSVELDRPMQGSGSSSSASYRGSFMYATDQ